MKLRLIWIVFVVLLAGVVQAEESYLCIGDNSVGFAQGGDGKWERQGFEPNKYIVKEVVEKPGEKSAAAFLGVRFVVKSFDTRETIAFCVNGFKGGDMECEGGRPDYFKINKDSLRFAASMTNHYFVESGVMGIVFVEIGKCSPL